MSNLYKRRLCITQLYVILSPDKVGKKNIRAGNFTEFRDISDGSHLRCGELNMTNLGFAKVSKSICVNLTALQLALFFSLTPN